MICPRCKAAHLEFPFGRAACTRCLRILTFQPSSGRFLGLPESVRALYLRLLVRRQVEAEDRRRRYAVALDRVRKNLGLGLKLDPAGMAWARRRMQAWFAEWGRKRP